MTKEIEFAGTSVGGSSYIDRMVDALLECPRVDIVIGIGEAQDAVFKRVSKRVEQLMKFMDMYSIHGRISVTIRKKLDPDNPQHRLI